MFCDVVLSRYKKQGNIIPNGKESKEYCTSKGRLRSCLRGNYNNRNGCQRSSVTSKKKIFHGVLGRSEIGIKFRFWCRCKNP